MMPNLKTTDYLYQPFYCEENIWQLCQREEFHNSYAVIISCLDECFPMLQQKSSPSPDEAICWDYHVIMITQINSQPFVLDFDSTLGFCTPLEIYLQFSFYEESRVKPSFIPLFRLMNASEYSRLLKTDRSHMKKSGHWTAPPPDWPLISETENNLPKLTNMLDETYGKVFSMPELANLFDVMIDYEVQDAS